jgi:asparagine synthase (glutamine-hydrolysing)
MPGAVRWVLARAGGVATTGSTAARGLEAVTARDPAARMLAMSRIVQPDERVATFTRDFLQPDAEAAIAQAVLRQADSRAGGALGETLYLDSRLALVDNMLLYFDKMSMAASLEVRVPFLDQDVVAFCTALPDSRRVWRTRRKEILKRASRGLVAAEIIDKKKRGFFHSALGAWLTTHRDTLFADTLLDERTRQRRQFEPTVVAALVQAAGEEGKKASQRLYCLLLLEKWQRFWVDADGPAHRLAAERRRTVA